MKTRIGMVMFACILCFALSFSCADSGAANLKSEVKELAINMDAQFSKLDTLVKELDKSLEDLFTNSSLEDIDISDMDEADGGEFYFFQDKMYLRRYDPSKDETLLVCYGAIEVTDEIKKKMKLQLSLEPKIMEIVKSAPIISRFTFNTTFNTGFGYPNGDVGAIIPAGLDASVFDWYQFFINEKEVKWLPAPIVGLGPEGWVHSIGTGVFVDNESIGEFAFDVKVLNLSNDLIKDASDNILLVLFKDTTVMAASPKAKAMIKVSVLLDYDYLEVLKTNPQLSEELRLNHEKQSQELQNLGKLIDVNNAGKETAIEFDGKKYRVFIEHVPGANYFIIGMI